MDSLDRATRATDAQDRREVLYGRRLVGICITCSNIKRTPAWSRRRCPQEDSRIATSFSPFRVAPFFLFFFLSSRPFLSSSICALFGAFFRILFLSFVTSISATFLTSVLLSSPPLVSQIVASSKGCREQKIFKDLRRRRSEINSRTRRVIRSAYFF